MTTRLLSVPQVADALGCSTRHVYNLIGQGGLRVVNIAAGTNSKTRIRESDLDAFVQSRTVAAS